MIHYAECTRRLKFRETILFSISINSIENLEKNLSLNINEENVDFARKLIIVRSVKVCHPCIFGLDVDCLCEARIL
jgi:hypothetical protein